MAIRILFDVFMVSLYCNGFEINSFGENIGVYFSVDDWFNNELWAVSDTHIVNKGDSVLLYQKCITSQHCYCSYYGHQHYKSLNLGKVKAFNCDIYDDNDFAANLDFDDYDSMFFDDEEDVFNLKFRGKARVRENQLPLPTQGLKKFKSGRTGDCPTAMSIHHIVPLNRLRTYWNYLIVNNKPEFRKLANAVARQAKVFADDHQYAGRIHDNADDFKAGADALVEAVKLGRFDVSDRINHWSKVQSIYEWMPGNLFAGPGGISRWDDPDEDFDAAAEPIVKSNDDGFAKWNALQYINDNIVANTHPDLVVKKIITYALKTKFIPFKLSDWEIQMRTENVRGVDVDYYKYRVKPARRRLLLNEKEVAIIDSVGVILDKNDWFNSYKWSTRNTFNNNGNNIHQKCRDSACYCRINGKKHVHHSTDYIKTFLCGSKSESSFSAYSMMVNDLRIPDGSDRSNKWSTIFQQPPSIQTPGRYCPVPLARHHLIPRAVLKAFWNKVVEQDKLQQMEPLLENWKNRAPPGDRPFLERLYINDGTRHTHLDGGTPPGQRYNTLKVKLIWMPGNLFVGPTGQIRSDDPNNGFEVSAERIFGARDFRKAQRMFGYMNDYIANPGGTTDEKLFSYAKYLWDHYASGAMKIFNLKDWEIENHFWKIRAPDAR